MKGDSSETIWHQWLGQPNLKILSLLNKKKTIDTIDESTYHMY